LKAAIVILNYNGAAHLEQFLPSVVDTCPAWAEIFVADNASTDHSIDFLGKNFETVHHIVLDENYGFAGGYNRALSQIQAEYYVILNSDVLVHGKWLETIISAMDSSPEVAASQPKIRDYKAKDHFEYAGASGGFIDENGYPFCRGRIFDTCERDIGQHNDNREIFWASGACLVVRSAAFHEVEGFDEDLFAHMEEIDLCWRLKNAGHHIYCYPGALVYHLGGGTLSAQHPKKTYLNFRNNLLVIVKNDYRDGIFGLIVKRMIMDGSAAFYMAFKRGISHFFAVLKAHFHFYTMLPAFIRKRKYWRKKAIRINRTGIFRDSIVNAYHIHDKKVFGALETRKFYRQDRRN
jgi:GT2 family glycosyltransferase